MQSKIPNKVCYLTTSPKAVLAVRTGLTTGAQAVFSSCLTNLFNSPICTAKRLAAIAVSREQSHLSLLKLMRAFCAVTALKDFCSHRFPSQHALPKTAANSGSCAYN